MYPLQPVSHPPLSTGGAYPSSPVGMKEAKEYCPPPGVITPARVPPSGVFTRIFTGPSLFEKSGLLVIPARFVSTWMTSGVPLVTVPNDLSPIVFLSITLRDILGFLTINAT
ncbi:MAG: hypothetical protein BWY05_00506 [Euryarchaeota archaeon ADurb.Bin165]|nr:MAG: hypothetical protein BWY05_00506 [Euryarchaeota archaeon ADurb.Bin165]